MNWIALDLSLKLAACTTVILLPIGIFVGRYLAWQSFRGKIFVEAALALPLVLPPTVLGFYMLVAFGGDSALGQMYQSLVGRSLAFSFDGLVAASVIFNLPFAIQPMQRAFEGIGADVREAAACCGMSRWRILWRIELPLAWPGILSALVLSFAHTIGEFGIVLMVGGNIPGETQTIAIAIYDRVQLFDNASAGLMSAVLLLISMVAISATYFTTSLVGRKND
ncbi:MAG TPA: molybdate ABC transporter permease subunit [Rhodospirillales bacterium]|nr:molybdate ABC transporter permease subunit [Rhodospirillales bacterium]